MAIITHGGMPSGSSDSETTRVLRIITRLNIGGPARHVATLTQALPSRGFASELIAGTAGKEEGTFHSELTGAEFLPSLARGVNPLNDSKAYLDLYRLIKFRRPQVVHTHLAKAGALGRLAARKAGVPVVVHTYHGHVLSGYFSAPVSRAFLEVERRLAKHTDVLIAISSAVRDELIDLGVGVPGQWRVVPLGLELGALIEELPDQAQARERLGLPRDRKLVGMVARMVPIKDVPTFIRALRQIAEHDRFVEFVVAGDGPLRKEHESAAKKALGDRVHFLGWVNDLADLYSALDLVVLTSKNEGMGAVLVEASAAGKPVIGTRVGGVPDVVQDEETGFLVPVGDAESIADKVLTLLSDIELAQTLGAQGREFVRERFAAARLVDDIAGLYSELLAN